MNEETYFPDCSSELEECHWDLYSIYEVHDEPPKEQLEYWKKKREANNALFDIDYQKFGKTEFFVYSRYSGSEHLQGKVKRLLFNDPMTQKVMPT